jgi:hypothetical protein
MLKEDTCLEHDVVMNVTIIRMIPALWFLALMANTSIQTKRVSKPTGSLVAVLFE